jgi:hypothetical protein
MTLERRLIMDANPKNNERRGRRLLSGLMQDWVWEVCLILVATPVVIDTFLSIGTNYSA